MWISVGFAGCQKRKECWEPILGLFFVSKMLV